MANSNNETLTEMAKLQNSRKDWELIKARVAVKAPLDADQQAAWDRMKALEAAHNKQADGHDPLRRIGLPKTNNYIPQSLIELEQMSKKLGAPAAANFSRERIAQIRSDASHPYNNPRSPMHKAAIEEMNGLYNAQYAPDGNTPVLKDE